MNTVDKSYSAKLLLFGEHTVIVGSQALATPYPRYEGKWSISDKKESILSNRILRQLAQYFIKSNILHKEINFKLFDQDLQKGLFFDSGILQGFGIGSSGALCAAIYDRYKTTENLPAEKLKELFVVLESYFHGSSSGVDPLICYLNKMIIIENGKPIQLVKHPRFTNSGGGIFLINTTIPRKTGPLVNIFLRKYENPAFKKMIDEQLSIYHNQSISSYLMNDKTSLLRQVREISLLQYSFFQEFIPSDMLSIWEEGNRSEVYSLKLCGAGGGGFILGFTDDYKETTKFLNQFEVEFVHHL